MPFAFRGGHRIHYRTFGDPAAPPVLLIMGLGLSAEAWLTLPERLSQTRFVLTFDNRGCGQSDLPRGPYTMAALADDALAVLDAAGLARADVVGVSMGGMIAQHLALRHPARLRKLVLGCTIPEWARQHHPRPQILLELLRVLARKATVQQTAALLVGPGFIETPEGAAAFTRWREAADRGRARRAVLQLSAIALHSTRAHLGRITVPTLVVTGDHDRLVRPENSYELARKIPGAQLHVFKGAGHVFPLEREAELSAKLGEFFA
jgi:pimeloyl-ACP methyl ester carboxylesterase